MKNERIEALTKFLAFQNETTEDETRATITGEGYTANEFETEDGDYLVLTDGEADTRAIDSIKNDLWAFNSDFIVEHMKGYFTMTAHETEAVTKALQEMQSKLCENANALVYALIEDIDEFVSDAIDADGRGHFISWYDGDEHEQDGFYIYRTN